MLSLANMDLPLRKKNNGKYEYVVYWLGLRKFWEDLAAYALNHVEFGKLQKYSYRIFEFSGEAYDLP